MMNTFLLAVSCALGFTYDDDPFVKRPPPAICGRWDITVHGEDGDHPSWLEIRPCGYRSLVGSYVGRVGSARPIGQVHFENDQMHFTVPPQWEHRTTQIEFSGKLEGDVIRGTTTNDRGVSIRWVARRAPELKRNRELKWGETIELFNGKDLSGWKLRESKDAGEWSVRGGNLTNSKPGRDLLSDRTYSDFKLRTEFRYPKGSNSGVYLRGRYEVQIEDNFGEDAECHKIGAIYGFLTPSINAAKPPGEWQALEVTMTGRIVSVSLNGERIIDRQTIPGITGGALDSNENLPGPIMLQGDHGPIEFRSITITPANH